MIYTFQPTLVKNTGHHNIRFGYDFRSYRLFSNSPHCLAGCYTFGSTYTSGPLSTSASAPIGQDIAALVLGQPTGGSIQRNGTFADQSLYNAAFVHDDWKLTRKLTLNLGVRYEYEAPPTERYNQNTRGFDFTDPNPIQGAAQAAYAAHPISAISPANFKVLGGCLFASPQNRGFFDGDRNNFQPRIGAAYALNDKTAIRAGWGMFMVPNTIIGSNQPGYSQTTSLVPSNDGGLTFAANLANPFPTGAIPPAANSLGLQTFLGQSITTYPLQARNGLSQSWQFDIQRELPGQWLLDVAYVGTRGFDLPVTTGILGAIPGQYLSTSPIRDTTTINFLAANVTNPFQGLTPGGSINGSTVKQSQLLLPYPEFTNLTTYRFDGGTHYNALQIRLQKRFAGGFTLLTTYAWSKLMEHDFFQNTQDTNFISSISPSDVTQRFVLSGIWEVPVGRGRKFGSHMARVLDAFIGGWQGNWIYTAQSGFPLQWGDVYYNGNPDSLRANITGSTATTGTFDTSGFYFADAAVQSKGVVSPALQRSDPRINLANNYRNFPNYLPGFRGQGQNTVDIEALKKFGLGERRNIEIRCDFLNAFNHPEFSNPALSPTSGSFGLITSQANFPRNIQVGLWLNF